MFFVGLHQPSDARHFDRSFVSVNRLRQRKGDFVVGEWILDSGAFSELSRHGRYRESVEEYARRIERWALCGNLLAAVTQDYMCEPFMLAKTGLTLRDHQRLTIERFDALRAATNSCYYVMPVLQGYAPHDYVRHVDDYGYRLHRGQWVGVGSVCKRNASVREIITVLGAIRNVRPDLRLHGFGLKITALQSAAVRDMLHSADSMAWSYAARMNGRSANDWREAKRFEGRIERADLQTAMFL